MRIQLRHRKGRCFEYLDREGKWKSTGSHEYGEAMTIAGAMLTASGTENFGDFAERVMYDERPGSYIDMMRELGKIQDSTLDEFRDAARIYVLPYFRKKRLGEITAPIIQVWYMNIRRKDGLKASSATCNHALAALSRILGFAELLGKIEKNPCTLIKKKKRKATGHPMFTPEELKILFPEDIPSLIDLYGSLDNALFFLICRDTGFRPCEVAGLTTDCYHPQFHCIFTKQTCDRKTRIIKMSVKTTGRGYSNRTGFILPFTEKIMNMVLETRPAGSCLFVKKDGTLKGQNALSNRFTRLLKEKGMYQPGKSLYSFRSTFFSNILADHTDEAAIMLMGQKNWHDCYDQRTPEQIITRTKRILESSNL